MVLKLLKLLMLDLASFKQLFSYERSMSLTFENTSIKIFLILGKLAM